MQDAIKNGKERWRNFQKGNKQKKSTNLVAARNREMQIYQKITQSLGSNQSQEPLPGPSNENAVYEVPSNEDLIEQLYDTEVESADEEEMEIEGPEN